MYEEIILNCFRYLDFKRLVDIEILTFIEYSYRLRAFELQKVDKRYYMHLQAWLNNQVKATKEQGKKHVSVFNNFKDFFDYEKEIKEIRKDKVKGLTDKQKQTARYVALINSLK